MTEQQALGIRLKSLLDELGLTQIAMSELVGVHQGYFNQIIKGHKRISATVIFSIAKRYKNVNLRWLLTGEGTMYGLETIYEQPPPELPAGDQPADQVQEPGIEIQYLNKQGMQGRIEDHERRLQDLERLLKGK